MFHLTIGNEGKEHLSYGKVDGQARDHRCFVCRNHQICVVHTEHVTSSTYHWVLG
jgi:hypothetical protein